MRHLAIVTTLVWALLPGCSENGDDDSVDDDTIDDDTTDDDSADDDDTGDGCEELGGEPTLDAYGGDLRVSLDATGFFRTEKLCDRWWLVTPGGHPTYSLGVNNVGPYGDTGQETGVAVYSATVTEAYESHDEWADTAVERLHSWGFNTAGCWSNAELMFPRMPFTLGLSLAGDDWIEGTVSDYYSTEWEAAVEEAAAQVAQSTGDPNLIGYFIDNESRWGSDWRGTETLLQLYLELAADTAGKQAATLLLLDELGGVQEINTLLGTSFVDEAAMLAASEGWDALGYEAAGQAGELVSAFLEQTADRYFDVTTSAIRAHDPDHMVLGNREVSVTTRIEVYRAAAPYVDLFSINNYVFFDVVTEAMLTLSGSLDPADGFTALAEEIDKPILISEFGFRADDSGLPNTWPPQYPTHATQDERADAFEEYARDKHTYPWIVGYHWFQWLDQPMDGRFDGENNNFGLVSEQDEVYEVVTGRMAEVNPAVWDLLRVPR